MRYLKQSTAATVKIGPFVDATDGVTAETGLTISQADVRLAKDGGNYAQKTESSASTHDELGEYDCDLDATDTATLGSLVLSVQESGALPVRHEFTVLAANVYDSIVGGGDNLPRPEERGVVVGLVVLVLDPVGVPRYGVKLHLLNNAVPDERGTCRTH